MKLRTVLYELACTDWRAGREELLDEDVLLLSKTDSNTPSEAKLLLLARLSEFQAGEAEVGERDVALVLAGTEIPAELEVEGNFVVVAAERGFDEFREQFLELPGKAAVLELRRTQMFSAFLASYDLAQFAKRSSEVLGNPVIISNADMRLLAKAGDFPEDAKDVQEVLSQGYLSEEVNSELEGDGTLEAVRHSRHSILSKVERYGRHWVTSIIYFHHLEMGRYDVLEMNRPVTGFDLELVDYAGLLAGIMIDRLGAAGERVGSGSSVLHDLVEGSFVNEQTMRAQLTMTRLPLDSTYVIVVITGQRNADKDYHARIGSMADRALRDSLWCARDNCLVILTSIGKSEQAGYDDYVRARRRLQTNKALSTMLENNELSAFVSEPFEDLAAAPGRLRESLDLVEAVNVPAPGKSYFFWEHRFAALASAATSPDLLECLLDKRVVAMAEYDREHGTAYLQTSIMSIRYPGSPADAANALNVHRNTYFYRMNKVRELFFIDLKDGDDRLALSFSVSLMEGMMR